jgi:antibiotic biosynthesis monooxygenase (ABM) superfamily enzyme
MVVGMEGRLLPIFAGYWCYANTRYKGPVPSQHEMPWRHGQELAFVLWLFGVPALAAGFAFDAIPFVRAAAWSLFAASIVDTVNVVWILHYAFVIPSSVRARGEWLV